MRNYPDFIAEYIEYTRGHEATERIHKWSVISILAASMERRFWMNRGHYTLFPNLYVFIIGKSGLIKKSTSTGIAVNLFRELKGAKMMSERLTAASLIEQLRASGKRLNFNGKAVFQSALFAYASELAVFLAEVWGSTRELLTTFYDCIPNDYTKPWTNTTLGGGEIRIHGPCLNILGASTKAWLRQCIPRTEMEGGFTSRCVFVVEDTAPEPIAWPMLTPENEVRKVKLTEDLRHIYSMWGEMKCTKQAYDLFDVWYRNHMKFAVPLNQDPAMSGYLARKGDLALKIAMVRSISLGDSLLVTPQHLDWALTEIDRLENNWRLAFDGLNVSPLLGLQIKEFVFKRRTATRDQIIENFRLDNVLISIEKELALLLDAGELLLQSSESGDPLEDTFSMQKAASVGSFDSGKGIFVPDAPGK